MSKTLDTIVQARLNDEQVTGCYLVKAIFNGGVDTIRLTNAAQNIYWDEGAGEQEYLGAGDLLGISALSESTELSAQSFSISLSAVDRYLANTAMNVLYNNTPVWIYFATLDNETYAVEGGVDGPILICAGRADNMSINYGKDATLTLTVSNRLSDWSRARGGRYTNEHQRTYVDEYDSGFEYLYSLQRKEINWGGIRVAPGGPGRPPGIELPYYSGFTPEVPWRDMHGPDDYPSEGS